MNLRSGVRRITIDPTQAYFLQAEFKKLSGTTNARFRLRCLNSSVRLYLQHPPTSLAGASGVNVPTTWSRYGGIIWPSASANTPKWPAGTTKYRSRSCPQMTRKPSFTSMGLASSNLAGCL